LNWGISSLSLSHVPETFLNLKGIQVRKMTKQTTNFPRDLAANGLNVAIRATERTLGSLRAAYRSLTGTEAPVHPVTASSGQQPAVPIEMSVMPDYIVCLEDGRRFKMLKGHLRSSYNMSPEEYREKWGLPEDYPMVAPNYREKRIRMAKDMGLGHMRKPRARKKTGKADRAESKKAA
jgi:predicted transcriptional regulator